MGKIRRIHIPKELQVHLGVSEDVVNDKLQALVDDKIAKGFLDAFEEKEIANDYFNRFSKEELICMFIHTSAEAATMEYRLVAVAKESGLSTEKLREILNDCLPSDEEVFNSYKEDNTLPTPPEEDFT